MPTAALRTRPTETLAPGLTRRRVWTAPAVCSHTLVILTTTKFYLSPYVGPAKPGLATAIENGADLDDATGPLATVVDLFAVRKATLDLGVNTLTLEYTHPTRTTASVTVTFATAEAADEVFTKLWRRLGENFDLTPVKSDFLSVARVPLAVMAGILMATATLAVSLSISEDFVAGLAETPVPQSPLEHALGWMDWRWVCGFGGAALAVGQVWLYRKLTRPPVRLDLVRR